LRRKTLLLELRPDLDVQPLRGNVDTRLRKLHDGVVDAIVLARAGLHRLGLSPEHQPLEPELMLPAVGQGALGIECRADDAATCAILARSDDRDTRLRVGAERAFMASVGGSCQLPVAAYAVIEGEELWLRAMVAEPDGSELRFGERRCSADAEGARDCGQALGRELRER
jgi:hydroxymethylbilane synthase